MWMSEDPYRNARQNPVLQGGDVGGPYPLEDWNYAIAADITNDLLIMDFAKHYLIIF